MLYVNNKQSYLSLAERSIRVSRKKYGKQPIFHYFGL